MVIEIVPEILDIFTLISGIVIFLIVLGFFYNRMTGKKNFPWFSNFLKSNYFLFGLIVSLAATLGSLFYSEIMGYGPCTLCWYQRIFMYPQVFLFAFAIWKKDRKVVEYSMILSIIGGIIALYHYLGQLSFVKDLSCSAVGYSASCSDAFFVNYGYITIPMMALTAFVLLIVLGLAKINKQS